MALAQPLPDSAPHTLPRRAVWGLWGGLAGGAVLSAAGTVAYLWPRRAFDRGDAGTVTGFPMGAARYFAGDSSSISPVAQSGYYVVYRVDGFVAFVALCAHQAADRCRLAWRLSVQPEGPVGRFYCPRHGGAWRQDTGEPVTTPPPYPYSFIPHSVPALPLVSLPVRVADGRVRVQLYGGVKYRQLHQPPLIARVSPTQLR